MDRLSRKQKLEELVKDQNNIKMTGIPLRYRGQTTQQNVYRIPLSFLVYNKYNGRIASAVFSYEKQNGKLDPEKETDNKIIEKYLWESKIERNEFTLDNLKKNGQQRYGIVTADGIIVDGNRRAMLLNKLYRDNGIDHAEYFLAIILPQDATEKDINELEAAYQLGEDDKLDYNPIEKYLKCRQLTKSGTNEKRIAELMGEKESQIKEWLEILGLMDKYLSNYGYDGMYTRLVADTAFVDLFKYLKSYRESNKNTRSMDWQPGKSDLSDLQTICFDYIRAGFEVRDIREIAKTGKAGSIFFYEGLWDEFKNEHNNNIPEEKSVEDLRAECASTDLSKLLRKRDEDWKKEIEDKFTNNLDKHKRRLEDRRDVNKPAILLDRALNTLQQVNITGQEGFATDSNTLLLIIADIEKIVCEMKRVLEKSAK